MTRMTSTPTHLGRKVTAVIAATLLLGATASMPATAAGGGGGVGVGGGAQYRML